MERLQHGLAPIDSIVSLGELLGHSDYAVKDGELVWVRSVRCAFAWRRENTTAADGISIVGSAFAPGRWLRETCTTDPSWTQQALWYIDPTNGSDENVGSTLGAPIKTWAELRRRLGPNKIKVSCAIYLVGDLNSSDPMIVDFGSEASLVIGCVTTTVRTSTITTFTARDAATNAPATLDDGVFVWTPYLGPDYFIYMMDGPAIGCAAQLLLDVGGGTARVSSFVDTAGAEQTPVNGNTYRVARIRQVAALYLDPSLLLAGVTLQNLEFAGYFPPLLGGTAGPEQVVFLSCSFWGITPVTARQSAATFINCSFVGLTAIRCNFVFYGGACKDIYGMIFQDGGASELYRGFICQGSSITAAYGAHMVLGDAAAMDWGGLGLYGVAFTHGSSGYAAVLWGVSAVASTVGGLIDSTSQLEGSTANTRYITGATGDQVLGDTAVGSWPAVGATVTKDATTLAAFMHD